MSLKNPAFRNLLRSIIAAVWDDMKQAYRMLFQTFREDAKKAARFLWAHRKERPYNAIGHDEILPKVIEDIYNVLTNAGKEPTVITKFLEYFQDDENKKTYIPSDPRMSTFTALKNLPEDSLTELKAHFGLRPVNKEELYNELNIALKEQVYKEFLKHQGALTKRTAPSPSPQEVLQKYAGDASEINFSIPKQLKVLQLFLDSYGN